MAASLCNKNEIALFECSKGARSFALCASKDLGPKSGTLQYRAARNGKIELAAPGDSNKSAFVARMTGSGVKVDFANVKYDDVLSTDARDLDDINDQSVDGCWNHARLELNRADPLR